MSNCLFYECLSFFLFFFPSFYFFPFLLPLLLGFSARSSVLGVSSPSLADTWTSPVRPVHGTRWLWSHAWMGVGNTATPGRRLGRWFHLAAPLISLLELVEVFNVSLFPSLPSPHSKCLFSKKPRHVSLVVSLSGTDKKIS